LGWHAGLQPGNGETRLIQLISLTIKTNSLRGFFGAPHGNGKFDEVLLCNILDYLHDSSRELIDRNLPLRYITDAAMVIFLSRPHQACSNSPVSELPRSMPSGVSSLRRALPVSWG